MTMWSLALPQVAATLAATLVAFDTRNPAGQRLIDSRLLNVVLVLMVITSILGPVLTEHFAPPQRRNATGSNEDRRNTLIPQERVAIMSRPRESSGPTARRGLAWLGPAWLNTARMSIRST